MLTCFPFCVLVPPSRECLHTHTHTHTHTHKHALCLSGHSVCLRVLSLSLRCGLCCVCVRACPHSPPHPLPAALEQWNDFRENTHLTFRFTKKTLPRALLWGAAVPLGVYLLIKGEQQQTNTERGKFNKFL